MKRSSLILYLYAGVVAAAGCALFAVTLGGGFDSSIFGSLHFWLLAAGVIAGEFIHIKVPHRQEVVSVTVGDPFTLSLLFTFGLGPAMVVKIVATVLEDLKRRQTWWKTLFNVGQFSLSLGVGYWVFRFSGYSALIETTLDAEVIFLAILGAFTYFAFNLVVVTTAISMAIGEPPLKTLRSNLVETGVIQQAALLGFTPVVTAAVHDSAALFPLLLIPIIVVYQSGQLMQKQVTLAEQLRELYETTRIANSKVGTRESVRELSERVCSMFGATSASITFFPREGEESSWRTTLDVTDGSFAYMEPVDLDPTQGVWARAASESRAILLADPIENPRLKAHFEGQGVRDLMIAAMHSEDAVNGLIEVRNHRGPQSFKVEDLKLFETFANHASIALENARLINELEDSLVHLTEMNRLKDDFVASVSHELRTPLTSIQGYVKTLLRVDAKFPPEQQRSFLETVDKQSNRLHRLIEDLLAVSRLESHSEPMSISLLSLEDLAREVVEELRDKTGDRDVTLDFEKLPALESDEGKVHQILINLVDNALKYTPAAAPVVIEGRALGDGASISVIDAGPGIPLEVQDLVFDRFYQVDQSATRTVGGTGLGLYICRRMAETIGGRVWLERSGPEGSVFSLWVPPTIRPALAPDEPIADPTRRAWKI